MVDACPVSFGGPVEMEGDDWMRFNKVFAEAGDRGTSFLAQFDAIFGLFVQNLVLKP